MDKKLAKHVAAVAIRSAMQLTSLVPLLKTHCKGEEYKTYATAIATAAAHIDSELLSFLYARHPELEKEIEAEINEYGVVL